MNRKAVIFGIKSHKLLLQEKVLFKKAKPWGIILFSRNILSFVQLKNLTQSIKNFFNDKKFPILIDQEGGSVSRLSKIVKLTFFSQKFLGQLFYKDKKLFYNFYKIHVNEICNLLKELNININTVPVLDIERKRFSNIIGNRSFSEKSKVVTHLGSLCTNLYKKNKIGSIIKHIPGLGLSFCDSHYETPIINLSKKNLIEKDFAPFKSSKSLFAMTAHAIFSKYDSINTATHSKIIIKNVIRKHMKFKGLIMSDDICMKSLKYNLEKNALMSLKSGCNLVLHCNGNIAEMSRLIKVIPNIDKFTQKKTSQFYNYLG